MMASVDPIIALTVAEAPSANKAWDLLHTAYANKIHTHIFNLRDQLQNTKKTSKTIAEYLQEVRSLSKALKVVGSPVNDDELVVKILSVLGPEYHEITAKIRALDSPLSFEELFYKLTDHELFLKYQDLEKPSIITAAIAQKSHTPPQFTGTILTSITSRGNHLSLDNGIPTFSNQIPTICNRIPTISKAGDKLSNLSNVNGATGLVTRQMFILSSRTIILKLRLTLYLGEQSSGNS